MKKYSSVTLATINVTINNKCTAARREMKKQQGTDSTI